MSAADDLMGTALRARSVRKKKKRKVGDYERQGKQSVPKEQLTLRVR